MQAHLVDANRCENRDRLPWTVPGGRARRLADLLRALPIAIGRTNARSKRRDDAESMRSCSLTVSCPNAFEEEELAADCAEKSEAFRQNAILISSAHCNKPSNSPIYSQSSRFDRDTMKQTRICIYSFILNACDVPSQWTVACTGGNADQ